MLSKRIDSLSNFSCLAKLNFQTKRYTEAKMAGEKKTASQTVGEINGRPN